jgi:hypothetical protein
MHHDLSKFVHFYSTEVDAILNDIIILILLLHSFHPNVLDKEKNTGGISLIKMCFFKKNTLKRHISPILKVLPKTLFS